MTTRTQISLVSLLLFALVASLHGTDNPAKPVPPEPAPVRVVRVQWEYLVEIDINDLRMNQLGSQGWEMVGFQVDVSRNSARTTKYIFKRPKQAE